MLDEIDPILMLRYLAGECTPAERKHIAAWMDSAPSGRAEIDAYRRLTEEWRALGSEASKAPAMLERLHRMMDEDEARSASAARTTAIESATARAVLGPGTDSSSVQGRHIGRAPGGKFAAATNPETLGITPHPSFFRIGREGGTTGQTWPRWAGGASAWRVAAAAMVVAVGTGLAIGLGRHRSGLGEAAGREYATAAGQRLSVTLVDGTQLTLAPASRVRVAADYGRSRRGVSLEGEAYFAVAHDSRHPFAVRAGNARAEDLGTRFVVRSYPAEPVVRVVVADGAVSLSDTTAWHEQRLVMPSGTLGEVNRAGVTRVTHGVNAADYVAWTRGELRFVNVPLRDALAELSRWYGLDIQILDQELAAQPVSASFANQSADAVLTSLATVFGAHWQRVGRVVVFAAGTA